MIGDGDGVLGDCDKEVGGEDEDEDEAGGVGMGWAGWP